MIGKAHKNNMHWACVYDSWDSKPPTEDKKEAKMRNRKNKNLKDKYVVRRLAEILYESKGYSS